MLYLHIFLILICTFIIIDSQLCTIDSNISLPLQVFGHQTAYDITSNILYLIGGISSDSLYKWDIHQNTWTELGVNTPNLQLFESFVNSAVTIDRILYLIGMDDDSYNSGKIYIFDLITAQWLDNTQITSPSYPSIRGCVTQNTTHILMVGGQTSENTFLDKLQIYSLSQNIWITETITISPIQNNGWICGYCQSVGIDLYVFGGGPGEVTYIDNMFKYNPSDKWTSIGMLPQAQSYGVAVYHEEYDVIYIVGGQNNNLFLDTIYVFDINEESITETWTMQRAKADLSADIIEDNLYVFGGDTKQGNVLSTIEICSIPRQMLPTQNPSVSNPTTADPTTRYPSSNPSETASSTSLSYPSSSTPSETSLLHSQFSTFEANQTPLSYPPFSTYPTKDPTIELTVPTSNRTKERTKDPTVISIDTKSGIGNSETLWHQVDTDIVIGVIIGVTMGWICFLCCVCCFIRKLRKKNVRMNSAKTQQHQDIEINEGNINMNNGRIVDEEMKHKIVTDDEPKDNNDSDFLRNFDSVTKGMDLRACIVNKTAGETETVNNDNDEESSSFTVNDNSHSEDGTMAEPTAQ